MEPQQLLMNKSTVWLNKNTTSVKIQLQSTNTSYVLYYLHVQLKDNKVFFIQHQKSNSGFSQCVTIKTSGTSFFIHTHISSFTATLAYVMYMYKLLIYRYVCHNRYVWWIYVDSILRYITRCIFRLYSTMCRIWIRYFDDRWFLF